MSNLSNAPKQLEMLELIAAVRAILTIAKAVQERQPKATVDDIAKAIQGGVVIKLSKLQLKGYSNLTPAQKVAYKALDDAQSVIPQVQVILYEAARDRTPEEIEAFTDNREVKLATAKAKREETKAKKAAAKPTDTADMFADEEESEDA